MPTPRDTKLKSNGIRPYTAMNYTQQEDDSVNSFTAATRLLEKRREMLEVQQTLRSKRDEYNERLDKIKNKEDNLTHKRVELTENIIQLDKFIADNEIKTTRAKQKKDTEKKSRLVSEDEIEKLKAEIEKCERDLIRKQKLLAQRDEKYHKFLQQVVMLRGDDNPEDVDRVIARYDRLAEYNEDLNNGKIALDKELAIRKKEEKDTKEAKKNYNIALNHKISTLSKKLEKKIEANSDIKGDAEDVIDQSNKTKVMLGQLEMACQNLYTRVTMNGSRIKRVHDNISNDELDMMKMLKVIHDCMSDFLYIVNKEIATLPEEERAKVKVIK